MLPVKSYDYGSQKYGEIIGPNRVVYDKKVAIIYNPTSGKRINIRKKLSEALTEREIQHEFFETQYSMHGWELISNEIDLDQYSAVVAVGGDGTIHEIVNGMLSRQDKKRVPLCFIPNGSGNDTLRSFGTYDADRALTGLIKA